MWGGVRRRRRGPSRGSSYRPPRAYRPLPPAARSVATGRDPGRAHRAAPSGHPPTPRHPRQPGWRPVPWARTGSTPSRPCGAEGRSHRGGRQQVVGDDRPRRGRHPQPARDLVRRPAAAAMRDVRRALLRSRHHAAGEAGGGEDHAEGGDPGLPRMLKGDVGQHRGGDVAPQHLGRPQLPVGTEAVQPVLVAAVGVEDDQRGGGGEPEGSSRVGRRPSRRPCPPWSAGREEMRRAMLPSPVAASTRVARRRAAERATRSPRRTRCW